MNPSTKPIVAGSPAVHTGPFFVVGASRSGTTLLRVMLDSHPRLAVPPESHWIITLRAPWLRLEHRPEAALEAILSTTWFQGWGLDVETTRDAVLAEGPTDFIEVVRAVHAAYARWQGKTRWGDKTPGYVKHLPTLASLFPDARFIHMVRDGRESAVSLASMRWGTRTAVSGAFEWRRRVAEGEQAGHRLGPDRYQVVRLEDLISDTEGALTRICGFVGETYEPVMLNYPDFIRLKEGSLLSRDHHRHLVLPPTPGLRDWTTGLSARERLLVEAGCGPWLRRFGYPTSRPATKLTRAQASIIWLRDMAVRTVPHTVWGWMHPTSRGL